MTAQVYPPFETVIDGRSCIYYQMIQCKVQAHSKWLVELGCCSSLPPHLKLSLLVDQVCTYSVTAHVKQLAELGHCSSLLLKLPA